MSARRGESRSIARDRGTQSRGGGVALYLDLASEEISPEIAINSRPLTFRTDRGGAIFRIEAALAEEFRAALRRRTFTEIFTSKIVASATEGGTNLFAIKYFDRAAYLAQSPQFYKEHAVAGMERVFETGHVYRAEPHASSRHLCEYLSLDLEIGFIDGLDDIIELEREVLTEVFAAIREPLCASSLAQFDRICRRSMTAPIWTFEECLDRLRNAHDAPISRMISIHGGAAALRNREE